MKWLQGLGLGKEPAVAAPEPMTVSSPESNVSAVSETSAAVVEPAGTSIVDSANGVGETPSADTAAPAKLTAEIDLVPLLASLADVASQQRDLQQLFESKLRSDEVQGKALEKLHDELQQYKTNFVRQSLTPLLKEVIFCHDFVVQQANKIAPANTDVPPAPDAASKALDAVRQMLLDLLYKFDVEPFRNESGTDGAFDPRTQQCLKTLPTDQPDLDKRVAEQGACGFRSGETILRRELVIVYKYSGSSRPATDAAPPRSTP